MDAISPEIIIPSGRSHDDDNWDVAIEVFYATAREAASLTGETIQGYSDTEDCEEIARIAAFQIQHADSIGGFLCPEPEAELLG